MLFDKFDEGSVRYRVIVSKENIGDGGRILYGVEGVQGDKKIVLKALSDNEFRIEQLVEGLNKSKLELCKLEGVICGLIYEPSTVLRLM